jgi:FkbH-like protein
MGNEFPFDGSLLLKKAKRTIRELREDGSARIPKKIAVLGGSTTFEIVRMMEIFLLREGIDPSFYESEYAQYYEDAVFGNPELDAFKPDLVYVYTSFRNLKELPSPVMGEEEVQSLIEQTAARFQAVWDGIRDRYRCPVIQNNFEFPPYRIMGNYEAVSKKGTVRFVNELNRIFAESAEKQQGLYLHDLQYLAARYGLDKWQDEARWNLYKYALSMEAVPELAYSVTRIIKSVFGRNKKVLALDLDNTLWGGVIGDDGMDGIQLGELGDGPAFAALQRWLLELRRRGILLAVCSKNNEDTAKEPFEKHPEMILRLEDIAIFVANWDNKADNIRMIQKTLNIGMDSLVFLDDNPFERNLVREMLPEVTVPELPEDPALVPAYLESLHLFEAVGFSDEDAARTAQYQAEASRVQAQASFTDYEDYLVSLDMQAEILPFDSFHYPRIAQLTQRSNQFNLRTVRYTESEIAAVAQDPQYVTRYMTLKDRFGEHGLISVVILKKEEDALFIDTWLMSCRVLRRGVENCLFNAVVQIAKENGCKYLIGEYLPTAKNSMVKDFYPGFGMEQIGEGRWRLEVDRYEPLPHHILF